MTTGWPRRRPVCQLEITSRGALKLPLHHGEEGFARVTVVTAHRAVHGDRLPRVRNPHRERVLLEQKSKGRLPPLSYLEAFPLDRIKIDRGRRSPSSGP
jgi:hypothetical protein